MQTDVDRRFADASLWREEAQHLRAILLDCGLDETLKWGKPCYTHGGKNIAIVQRMNAFLALMFFKGALLEDPGGLLQEQGKNSRSAKRLCFDSVAAVKGMEPTIRDFAAKAIAAAESGLTPPPPPALVLADELQTRLDADPALKAAFEGLTPGRRREYNLLITGAKLSKTRAERVDRHVARILAGKGLRDR